MSFMTKYPGYRLKSYVLDHDTGEMISTQDLATRWSCSRSSADRIARREGFKRVLLGCGRNGLVRYRLYEILAYERQRTIQSPPH